MIDDESAPHRIYILAGVNGAGKSSIGGAAFRAFGGDYFNPDEAAAALRKARPDLSQVQANSAAWQQGRRLLGQATDQRLDFALETTLGASTIPRLLESASAQGSEVHVWYAGLRTPEQHIERVRARVARGGHDIPEADIRRRCQHSRLNLIQLLPCLTALRVFDNSAEGDPAAGIAPTPQLVLHILHGRLIGPTDLTGTPEWAKPIVAAALALQAG